MPHPITLNDFLLRLKKEWKDTIQYVRGYTIFGEKCLFKCAECDHEWQATPKMILGVKRSGCPKCANSKRTKHLTQRVENYLEKIMLAKPYGSEYEWLEEYQNNNKMKLSLLHHSCGSIF